MRRTTAFGTALILAMGLAACGDDDPATSEGSSATAPDAAGDAGEAGESVTVAIGDFVFDPTPVEIEVGDSIVWENTHDQPHTASGNGEQIWDTGNLQPGATSDPVTFDEPGSYTYICGLHPFMEGTVEVAA